LPRTFQVLAIADNTPPSCMPTRFSWLWVLRFTFGSALAYNSHVFMIVLKFIYFLFLILFVYLDVVFTGILSFLRVSFFGL
jgi:hypothetical protein